jgi:hypothetical protein
VVASAAGLLAGCGALWAFRGSGLGWGVFEPLFTNALSYYGLGFGIQGGAFGVLVAAPQALVLRSRGLPVGGWIAATALTGALALAGLGFITMSGSGCGIDACVYIAAEQPPWLAGAELWLVGPSSASIVDPLALALIGAGMLLQGRALSASARGAVAWAMTQALAIAVAFPAMAAMYQIALVDWLAFLPLALVYETVTGLALTWLLRGRDPATQPTRGERVGG